MKIHNITIGDGVPKILGVLNISPESFYSDSFTPEKEILRRVDAMKRDGADIIDLGARSTALHAPPLSAAEEKERVISALRKLDEAGAGDDVVLSLDTMYPEVLCAALHFDLSVINDVSGLLNPEFAKLAADSGLAVISMASVSAPGDALDFFGTLAGMGAVLKRAESFGIDELILDPGIGKWSSARSSAADWELCRRYPELKEFGRPLLAAVSRKAFIGDALNRGPKERLAGSLGVAFALCEAGADLLRVHDVAETADIISVYLKLRR